MDRAPLEARLAPFGQQHLLRHWDILTDAQKARLAQQIESIDFREIARLHRHAGCADDLAAIARRAVPPRAIRLRERSNAVRPHEIRNAARHALRRGEVGVILVAGGQGTRLGFHLPKGLFSIGPVSGATLLQILLEKLLAISRRHDRDLPLYLMTSRATTERTEEYLRENSYFGLQPSGVRLFEQGNMPAVDAQSGKVLLNQPDQIHLSPDGHGGVLAALVRHGCLDDMEARGIRHLFYMQVDNPLVEVASEEFLGLHLHVQSEMSTQVVARERADDRLGVVVEVDGQVRMIEYSDLPEEIASKRGADGELAFWAGSIAVHLLDVAFLRRMSARGDCLPFHVARKKVEYLAEDGTFVVPGAPNAMQFERFIFDLLPQARNPLVFEVDRLRAFAPLKNASGAATDTPEFVRERLVSLHREWLRQAGADVPEGAVVEISPLFSLDGSDIAGKIRRNERVSSGTYFR